MASISGKIEVVKFLISNDADITYMNQYNQIYMFVKVQFIMQAKMVT